MIIMIMSLISSMLFLLMKHPLSMGMILIIQTMLVSLNTGLMINTFWFSYILVISILSGLLVLFIYMASVASNEKFKTPIISSIMFLLIPFIFYPELDQLQDKKSWSNIKNYMMVDNVSILHKLFNLHNYTITIMMVCYLFISMIVITFICNIHEGPLRMKN